MKEVDVNPASERSTRDYERAPVLRSDHAEGPITRLIEQQTAKLPSAVFLVGALGAMTASAVFELRGRHRKQEAYQPVDVGGVVEVEPVGGRGFCPVERVLGRVGHRDAG